MKIILLLILVTFVSYCIGRISHIIGGHLNTPHHWIYGLVLIIVGLILHKYWWGWYIFAFGLGLFISDFKDFLDHKFYGVDDVKINWN